MSKHTNETSRPMARRGRPSLTVLALLACGLLFAAPAHAYLDPGTGSAILQLLLGGVAGSMVVLNLYWTRVKAFFGISSDDEAGLERSETSE